MEEFLSEQPMAYHYHDIEDTVINFPESKLPRALDFKRSNNAVVSASPFDALPLEIIHHIMNILDLQSLLSLQKTSWTLLTMVNSFPAFRDILAHVKVALRAIAATRMLRFYTAHQLANALRSDRCINCNEFAHCLYLPTCQRVCHPCLDYANNVDHFRLISPPKAKLLFGLSTKELREFPKMSLLPGCYSEKGLWFRRRLQYIGLSRLISLKGTPDGIPDDDTYGSRYSHVAAAPLPYLHQESQVVQHGIWCRGCENEWYKFIWGRNKHEWFYGHRTRFPSWTASIRAFTMDEFVEHQNTCKGVENLQALYDSGEDDSTIEYRRSLVIRR